MLEAGFAGPVTVVVRVIGPGVLVGDTGEMWIEDEGEEVGTDTGIVPTLEEPWEVGWMVAGPEGVAEALDDPLEPGWLGTLEGVAEALDDPFDPGWVGEPDGIVTALDEAASEEA